MTFIHLHNHTEYSLLDGAARVKNLVAKAVELGMPAVALTDHGVMYGVINFYQAAKKAGVKPIIGCEVYVAQRSRFDKEGRKDDSAYHLVLLAENQTGYKNLCHLVSYGFTEGFYYKPRVDLELLRKYSEGLIALSACIAGQVPELIIQDRIEDAKKLVLEYQEIFGKGNYYLELQNHGLPEELKVNPVLAKIGKEYGIPLVCTNDIHYVEKSDANMHDILLCIQTGKIRDEENRMRFPNNEFYLKTEEEMSALFPEYPEALENTLVIAERCNVDFTFGELYLPNYEVPEGYDLHSYLIELCEEGFRKKYPDATEEVRKRLEYELGIIKQTGFSGYFLIVWDMINYARKSNIYVGPGRGSAAGSIVAFVLGITNIDPIRWGLLFERFLNPERVSPPDIDTDFCYERRGEVIEYLVQHYGSDKVGQIITFGTMLAKGAIRDVGRVLDIPYNQVDAVAKLVPHELGIQLKDALQTPELKQIYNDSPEIKELLDIALKIEGMPRHCGTHAAGVVIAREELTSYVPVQKTTEGFVTTQYEKEQVEQCGLLKMDLLGLRTLTVIGDAVDNIKRAHGIDIDINEIPLDDEKSFKLLSDGDTICVFQLESEGMRNILKNLRPERFEDIIAMVALYRPGPLGSGMVDQFISCKHGESNITYKHPLLEPILKETYGIILYQEQVMQIASTLAGFSLGQSDMLRRAMGKKKPEIIARERDHFVGGCVDNNIDKKVAGEIFDLMEYFAGYGFNKSHSAAYAFVTYQTAWLKAHYPEEFMASILTSIMDSTDKVPEYIAECNNMGITVLPPDINESGEKFNVYDGNIRFALAAVKNVGREAVKKIVEEREENGPFTSLSDLCSRLPLNKKMLESLIKCGAFDSMGHHRAKLLNNMEKILEIGRKCNQEKDSAQLSLFDFGMDQTAFNTSSIELIDCPEYTKAETLAMEKEVIGFYISGHPLDIYEDAFRNKASHTVEALNGLDSDTKVIVGGIITSIKQIITRNGKNMATFAFEDKTGTVKCVVFPQSYNALRDMILPERTLLLEGRIKLNDGVAEITVESLKTPLRLFIKIENSNDKALISEIKTLLYSFPGDTEAIPYYADLKQYSAFSQVNGVSPEKRLINTLAGMLGKENVIVK